MATHINQVAESGFIKNSTKKIITMTKPNKKPEIKRVGFKSFNPKKQ